MAHAVRVNGQHKTESHWCSPLPIVCLACSRSCCFVLAPLVLSAVSVICIVQSRPWMRHTAIVTLACAACSGNMLMLPLSCATLFVNLCKYDSLHPRICSYTCTYYSCISPASTKQKDKTVALQLISLASSRNPCIFYWDYQVQAWWC